MTDSASRRPAAPPVRRLMQALVPLSAAQVALAVVTAVVVPGRTGLIVVEALLAAGLVVLLLALRRRVRELQPAPVARTASTTRNGERP